MIRNWPLAAVLTAAGSLYLAQTAGAQWYHEAGLGWTTGWHDIYDSSAYGYGYYWPNVHWPSRDYHFTYLVGPHTYRVFPPYDPRAGNLGDSYTVTTPGLESNYWWFHGPRSLGGHGSEAPRIMLPEAPGEAMPERQSARPEKTYRMVSHPDSPARQSDRIARIEVRLPTENALLLVDGVRSNQAGAVRHFDTPALEGTGEFFYEFTAHWKEGGAERTATRIVRLRAGQESQVNFSSR